jgi:UDPglucose--hexose-1-phosphate uridylyltransferase
VPSELRLDPFTGAHTLIATGRASIGASRPGGLPSGGARCPFCPGHEADTEDTIWASGDPWDVRVVLNRFPLVDDTRAAGRHELVIESRAHDQDLVDLPVDALASLLSVYQSRVRALEAIPGIASVVLFRNRGRRAGSSQARAAPRPIRTRRSSRCRSCRPPFTSVTPLRSQRPTSWRA